jgi:hypothetical protein
MEKHRSGASACIATCNASAGLPDRDVHHQTCRFSLRRRAQPGRPAAREQPERVDQIFVSTAYAGGATSRPRRCEAADGAGDATLRAICDAASASWEVRDLGTGGQDVSL